MKERKIKESEKERERKMRLLERSKTRGQRAQRVTEGKERKDVIVQMKYCRNEGMKENKTTWEVKR